MIWIKPKSKEETAEMSELIRLRARACFLRDGGRCIRCGSRHALAPSHIYPKGRYPRMAWIHDNVKTLCNNCHIYWWHKHPVEAAEWIKTAIDTMRLERLKKMAQDRNLPPVNLKQVKAELEALIEKYLSEGRNDFFTKRASIERPEAPSPTPSSKKYPWYEVASSAIFHHIAKFFVEWNAIQRPTKTAGDQPDL